MDFLPADLAFMYADFAESASYAARDAAPVACRVMVDTNLAQYGEVATLAGKSVVISMRAAEIPSAPRRGDTFTLVAGARVFTVDSVISSDGFEHQVLAA